MDPASVEWDAIIVGTGMGGATLGHALAKAGQRVLFCERGLNYLAGAGALTGVYAEESGPDPGGVSGASFQDRLVKAGRHFDEVIDASGPHTRRFLPFVGAGSGGSSALYGMAFERFAAADFSPRANHPDATDASLEEAWPIRFEAFCHYYALAETLYRVRGVSILCTVARISRATCRPPAADTRRSRLVRFFRGPGLASLSAAHGLRVRARLPVLPGISLPQGLQERQRADLPGAGGS